MSCSLILLLLSKIEVARAEAGVGQGHVVEALVDVAVVVMIDEVTNGSLTCAGQVVVLMRVLGRAANVIHALVLDPGRAIAGAAGQAVFAKQPWPVIAAADTSPVSPIAPFRSLSNDP